LAALESPVPEIANCALVTLTAGWSRLVAQETARRETAAAHNEQQRNVGAQWNQRSRPVAVLGAPGMGYGFNVMPFLCRSMEGRVLHATSRELRDACRRTKWKPDVRRVSVFVFVCGCVCVCVCVCVCFVICPHRCR
jgi:hypothetical protein